METLKAIVIICEVSEIWFDLEGIKGKTVSIEKI
jgi:hypothetical protein